MFEQKFVWFLHYYNTGYLALMTCVRLPSGVVFKYSEFVDKEKYSSFDF